MGQNKIMKYIHMICQPHKEQPQVSLSLNTFLKQGKVLLK